MKYLKKVALISAVVLVVFFVAINEFSPSSNSGAHQTKQIDPKDDAFYLGILQAAAANEIEKEVTQSKMPPLNLKLDQIDSSVDIEAQKRILIVSRWRSGSTFLGELINSFPGVFYSYEPLVIFQGSKSQLIQSLFQCHFPADYLQQVNYVRNGKVSFMSRNWRAWSACLHDKSLCYNPKFVARMCSIFPVHLIKEVRLKVNELEDVLTQEETQKSWKIIYLVRDPRGIMASRANLTWCQDQAEECLNPKRHCTEVDDDLTRIEQLKRQFPNMFTVIKFEEFTGNVQIETEKLFRFLELPVSRSVLTFLDTHTSAEGKNDDPFATYRHTEEVASQWKSKLSQDVVANVTNACRPLLKRLSLL